MHLQTLRARWYGDHLGAEDVSIPLPTQAPPAVIPGGGNPPPIDQPETIRSWLAEWWYTVAWHKDTWNDQNQAIYRKILSIPFYYYGPDGWVTQPGWSYLLQLATLATQGAPESLRSAWGAVVARWQAGLDQQWAAASYEDRLRIGRLWQAKGDARIVKTIKDAPGALIHKIRNALPEPSPGLGFGAALGIVAAAGILLVVTRPDIVATQGAAAGGRWKAVLS